MRHKPKRKVNWDVFASELTGILIKNSLFNRTARGRVKKTSKACHDRIRKSMYRQIRAKGVMDKKR